MRHALPLLAAAVLSVSGPALAQAPGIEEAAHCRSLTNIVIPDIEESLVQLKPPTVTQQAIDEMNERLATMQHLRAESQAYIDAYPRSELSDEEVSYYLMGGNVILGARNPAAIREWTGQCRELFDL